MSILRVQIYISLDIEYKCKFYRRVLEILPGLIFSYFSVLNDDLQHVPNADFSSGNLHGHFGTWVHFAPFAPR